MYDLDTKDDFHLGKKKQTTFGVTSSRNKGRRELFH